MAHGDYANPAHGVAIVKGEMEPHEAPTRTHITSAVRGLVVLGRVKVAHAAIGIISHSATGADEPPINLEGNVLDGVEIDGAKLKVTLAEDFFLQHNTKLKLANKFAAGLDPEHRGLFLPLDGSEPPSPTFPEAQGMVKCTIVRKLEWDGPAHPTAEIHNHVVSIPHFGHIYFGEMFVKADARRLTMVRFHLGCDNGGDVAAAEGESNGPWWPPE
jgi:hypothetical protein